MPTPTVYPSALSFFGTGKEAAGAAGTAVAATRYPPLMKFDPLDDAHILIDEGLRQAMAKEYGSAVGKLWATASFDGNVMDDWIGDALLNGMGDYTTTATAAAPNSTLNGAVTAGATSVVVTSGTGFAANMWVQIGPDANGGAELVQIQSVSTNTLTLTAATPLRFAHATLSAVTNTTNTSGYTHVFSLLNSGTGQPPTHTWVDRTGITPSVGARAYPFGCIEELTFTANAEQLFKVAGKMTSFASAPTGVAPTLTPTSEVVQPSWYSTTTINSVPVTNISEWTWTLKRALIVKNTANGSQTPYGIFRGDTTVEGKIMFVAADESPLTTYLAGTQQPLVWTVSNGLSGVNLRSVAFQMTKGLYKKDTLKRDPLFGWEAEYGGIANATDAGFSASLSPAKVTLINQIPTY